MHSIDSTVKAAQVPQIDSLEEHAEGQVHVPCKCVFCHTNVMFMVSSGSDNSFLAKEFKIPTQKRAPLKTIASTLLKNNYKKARKHSRVYISLLRTYFIKDIFERV